MKLSASPATTSPARAFEVMHIDVIRNSTADSAGVQGINRLRWHAEYASQNARTGGPQQANGNSGMRGRT